MDSLKCSGIHTNCVFLRLLDFLSGIFFRYLTVLQQNYLNAKMQFIYTFNNTNIIIIKKNNTINTIILILLLIRIIRLIPFHCRFLRDCCPPRAMLTGYGKEIIPCFKVTPSKACQQVNYQTGVWFWVLWNADTKPQSPILD